LGSGAFPKDLSNTFKQVNQEIGDELDGNSQIESSIGKSPAEYNHHQFQQQLDGGRDSQLEASE